MERYAVITGGMGGVGKACARVLASMDYRLLLIYHTSPVENVSEFMKTLQNPSWHESYQCDITNSDEVTQLYNKVKNITNHIDVCIHTASESIKRSTIEQMPPNIFRRQFDVSLFGAFNIISTFLPIIKKSESGLIIGITTSLIETGAGTSRMPGYIVSKFALRSFLRELAHELRNTNIRTNAIAPDIMKTAFSSDLPERYFEWEAQRDPRGRITTPEDVAEKLHFLLSDKGTNITNKSLSVATNDIQPL